MSNEQKSVLKAFAEFLNTVRVPSTGKSCLGCGAELGCVNRTFFFEEQTWHIPIPICLKGHPTEQADPRYDA